MENSMFEPSVDTNLLHTDAHCSHRLPVIRLKPLLDPAQLEPGNAPRILRESLEVGFG
jgi:hypothetical protein